MIYYLWKSTSNHSSKTKIRKITQNLILKRNKFYISNIRKDVVFKIDNIDNNHTFLKNVKDICFKPSTFIKGLVFFWGDKREVFTKQSVVSQLRRSFMYWRTIALVFRFRNTFLNDRIFISTKLQQRRIWYYQYLWWFPSIMQIKCYNDTFLNNTHTLDFENYTCNSKLVFNTHTKNEKFFHFSKS